MQLAASTTFFSIDDISVTLQASRRKPKSSRQAKSLVMVLRRFQVVMQIGALRYALEEIAESERVGANVLQLLRGALFGSRWRCQGGPGRDLGRLRWIAARSQLAGRTWSHLGRASSALIGQLQVRGLRLCFE
jgi:hypothetical protein